MPRFLLKISLLLGDAEVNKKKTSEWREEFESVTSRIAVEFFLVNPRSAPPSRSPPVSANGISPTCYGGTRKDTLGSSQVWWKFTKSELIPEENLFDKTCCEWALIRRVRRRLKTTSNECAHKFYAIVNGWTSSGRVQCFNTRLIPVWLWSCW